MVTVLRLSFKSPFKMTIYIYYMICQSYRSIDTWYQSQLIQRRHQIIQVMVILNKTHTICELIICISLHQIIWYFMTWYTKLWVAHTINMLSWHIWVNTNQSIINLLYKECQINLFRYSSGIFIHKPVYGNMGQEQLHIHSSGKKACYNTLLWNLVCTNEIRLDKFSK